jgi:hypothetical protein
VILVIGFIRKGTLFESGLNQKSPISRQV